MKPILTIILSVFLLSAFGQEEASTLNTSKNQDLFSLGTRSTQSMFGSTGHSGMGFGGQFRIRVGNKISTEWFADYIKTDLGGLGHRETAHIGWSVMFYPLNSEVRKGALLPYVLAGHCFDFAKINGYQPDLPSKVYTQFEVKRWTSAVQLGLGASYYLSDRFDASFSAQYMSHLGNDLHVSEPVHYFPEAPHLVNNSDAAQLTLEGHLLLTFSLNYILSFKKPDKL